MKMNELAHEMDKHTKKLLEEEYEHIQQRKKIFEKLGNESSAMVLMNYCFLADTILDQISVISMRIERGEETNVGETRTFRRNARLLRSAAKDGQSASAQHQR